METENLIKRAIVFFSSETVQGIVGLIVLMIIGASGLVPAIYNIGKSLGGSIMKLFL